MIGTIKCGSTPCRLRPLRARLRVAKRRYALRAIVRRRLASGKSTKVRIVVRGNALVRLRAVGVGRLESGVRVTDATGRRVVAFRPVVKPPRAKANRK